MRALLFCVLAATCLQAAELDPLAVTEARSFKAADGTVLLYRLLKPRTVEPGRHYPLVLFLHGSGGRGGDNRQQIADQPIAVQKLANEPLATEHPCYVLIPQCPNGMGWSWSERRRPATPKAGPPPMLSALFELVAASQREFGTDPRRTYVTGLSMGGFGTYAMVSKAPFQFAAAVPVCGIGETSYAPELTHTPLWAFHGDKDPAVPVSADRDLLAAIRAVGGAPRYTEYPGVGHDSWLKAYADAEMWAWLFEQKLPDPAQRQTALRGLR